MKKKIKKIEKGFTLIEVVVSFGVLAIVVLLVARVMGIMGKTYKLASSQIDLYQNGRMFLNQISRELKVATPYQDTTKTVQGFFIFKSTAKSGWVSNSFADEIFFISSASIHDKQESPFVEFGYYLDDKGSKCSSINTVYKLSDDVIRRCSETDKKSDGTNNKRWNCLTSPGSSNWPFKNLYYDICYDIHRWTYNVAGKIYDFEGFKVEWYGKTSSAGVEKWNNVEFNPMVNNFLKGKIPRAVRITITLVNPEYLKNYGQPGHLTSVDNKRKLCTLTVRLSTTVYLENSYPF